MLNLYHQSTLTVDVIVLVYPPELVPQFTLCTQYAIEKLRYLLFGLELTTKKLPEPYHLLQTLCNSIIILFNIQCLLNYKTSVDFTIIL